MSDDCGRGEDGTPQHTPEEVEAFEERLETIGGMTRLTREAYREERRLRSAETAEARARGASEEEVERVRDRRLPAIDRMYQLFIVLVIMLIAIMALFYVRGVDVTGTLTGGSAREIERIAPPERAATHAEILPPEVVPLACDDCDEEVVQVPLDLNPEAKAQFAYDAGDMRMVTLTVLEGEDYEGVIERFDEAHESAVESGRDSEPPRYLDDVGGGMVVYGTAAVFKGSSGEECGIISSNMLLDVEGNPFTTVSQDELERLARIAAPRM